MKHGGDPDLDNHASPQRRCTTLICASKDECLENVKLLVNEYHADVKYVCGPSDAIVEAARSNDFKVVLILLESGADFKRKTDKFYSLAFKICRKTPETFLIENERDNFKEVIAWLKDHGVQWDMPIEDDIKMVHY